MTQLPLFESLGDDPARQPHAESARLLARLDNAKRYFRAQQDQIVALQAELETLKAALAHMQGEMETLKSANAQLEADLEQSRAFHSAAYAQSHSLWQERNALRAAVETLRLANLRLEFEINLHRLHAMDTSPTPPPGEAGQGPDTLWRKLLTLCHPDKWDQGSQQRPWRMNSRSRLTACAKAGGTSSAHKSSNPGRGRGHCRSAHQCGG